MSTPTNGDASPDQLRTPRGAHGQDPFRRDAATRAHTPDRPAGRVDVMRAVTGLRHIDPSTEPALVFSHFAAVCVPAVCDVIVIDMVEDGHGYRIRRPGATPGSMASTAPPARATDEPVLGPGSVTLTIPAWAGQGGPLFTGVLVFSWHDGYEPSHADAAFLTLMIDHATALVHRERLHTSLTEPHRAVALQRNLSSSRVLATAVGTVIGLHHVDHARAVELLTRISARTGWDRRSPTASPAPGTLPAHQHTEPRT